MLNCILAWTDLPLMSSWLNTCLTALTFGSASSTKYISLYPSAYFCKNHSALASPVLFPKPVMLSIDIFIPLVFNQPCIASAASAGLAVSINTFSGPYLLIWFFIFWSSGPSTPPLTLTKSVKSKLYPSAAYSGPSIGQSPELILTLSLPLVATIKFSPSIINVSSKSNVDIPLEGVLCVVFLARFTASSFEWLKVVTAPICPVSCCITKELA